MDELVEMVAERRRISRRAFLKSSAAGLGVATFVGAGLTFQTGGSVQDVDADFVICTIPFIILREIDIQVELPAFKRKVINELDYGTNAKLIVGTHHRVWRDQGYSGEIVSDADFQMAWDNSRLQAGEVGGITFYAGGQAGLTIGQGTPQAQATRLLPKLEAAFPGVVAAHNGAVERFHWPTHPFSKGSYACYRPGQWTTIAGAEIVPVGGLYFAGEHCSYEFQGYMNGAAETGRRVAQSLLKSLGWRSALKFVKGR